MIETAASDNPQRKATAVSFIVPQPIESYAADRSQVADPLLSELVETTKSSHEMPQMLSGDLAGGVLRMVALLVGAKRILEVGMFTGYGTLSLASALPEDGEIHTLELDPECVQLAGPFLERSPHSDKITVHVGPALDTMQSFEGPFDLVFIDADKTNYGNYYEEALRLLRPGGVILVDNALWSGRVLDPQDDSTRAIDALNRKIEADPRVDRVLLTVRDGMFLVRKR